MNKDDFKTLIIEPTLAGIGLGSPAATILLLGSAIIESGLVYLKQRPGPALGLYQIEPETHQLVKTWIEHRPKLKQAILKTCYLHDLPDDEALIFNLRYATCIARCLYASIHEPLPLAGNAMAFARYHKKYYNRGGKSIIEQSRKIFEEVIHDSDETR